MCRISLLLILALFIGVLPLVAQRSVTLLEHPEQIQTQPLSVLNSPHRETNVTITPDGSYLYFMSLRGGQPWSVTYMEWEGDSVFDGDIWYSKKVNGRWQSPRCLPYGINTSSGEDEPNISPGGKRVYYQSWRPDWQQTGGPYYVAQLGRGGWSNPDGLGGGITDFFRAGYYDYGPRFVATDGMAMSPNGRRMVVAVGHDYHRNMDLFISVKTPNGWSYCERMPISTPGNERSVFFGADGRTLYFASDGYDGYGGLDIYKTTINDDGTFGEVINIGRPFNTAGDDYGFILTADGNEGYFIRNGDIYFADLTRADIRMKPEFAINLSGTVRDSLSRQGLSAQVLLLNARTQDVVDRQITGSGGSYELVLPNRDAIYDQVVLVDGYPVKRRRLRISAMATRQDMQSHFLMNKSGRPLLAARSPNASPNNSAPTISKPRTPPAANRRPTTSPTPTVPESPPPPRPKPQITIDPVEKTPPSSTPSLPEVSQPTQIAPRPNEYSFEGVARNNLVFLFDVSGSMSAADRLPLLQTAFRKLVTYMRPEDQISIVIFSNNAEVILEATSAAQQYAISEALEGLGGSGSSRGRNGLRRAYRLADRHFIPDGNNRVIFATDGLFDLSGLHSTINQYSDEGIVLSVFSFGKIGETRRRMFEEIALRGGGNHWNISPETVDRALLDEARAVRQ